MEKAESKSVGGKGIPLAELFDGEDLVFAIYADNIVETSIEIICKAGQDLSEYAVRIELKPEKATEFEEVMYAYALTYLRYKTLRTEEKEIYIGGSICDGQMIMAYFEAQKSAKAYADWLKKMTKNEVGGKSGVGKFTNNRMVHTESRWTEIILL